jgi:hypothetical protein
MKICLAIFLIIGLLALSVLPASAGGPVLQQSSSETRLVSSDPCVGAIEPGLLQIYTSTTIKSNTNTAGNTNYKADFYRSMTWPTGTKIEFVAVEKFNGSQVNFAACTAGDHCVGSFTSTMTLTCADGHVRSLDNKVCKYTMQDGQLTVSCE